MLLLIGSEAFAVEPKLEIQSIDNSLHDIRNGDVREWSDFPADTPNSSYKITFSGHANVNEYALRRTQVNVM